MIFPIGAAVAELNNATVIHPLVNERTTKLMSYKLRQLRIVRGLRTKFSGFLKNYGLKMHGFQEAGDVFSFLRDFFCFQKYFSLYIGEIAI